MLDHWPNNPALSHFILENPWPALIILLAFSLILLWHYLQKRKRPLLILALACALLAGLIYLAAFLVTTPREKLIALNARLIHAVAPPNQSSSDMPTLQSLFAPTINFQITQSITQSQQAQPLLDLIDRVHHKYRLHNVAILANDARSSTPPSSPPNILESYFQVRVSVSPTDEGPLSGSDIPVTTDWLVQWSPQPDGSYKIVTLRWLKIDNREPASSLLP